MKKRSFALERALEVVEELGKLGYAPLPMSPTIDMNKAGAEAAKISEKEAERAYVAMINTAM